MPKSPFTEFSLHGVASCGRRAVAASRDQGRGRVRGRLRGAPRAEHRLGVGCLSRARGENPRRQHAGRPVRHHRAHHGGCACRRRWAARCSWRTRAVPAATSAWDWWRAPSLTATRCCCRPAPTRSTRASTTPAVRSVHGFRRRVRAGRVAARIRGQARPRRQRRCRSSWRSPRRVRRSSTSRPRRSAPPHSCRPRCSSCARDCSRWQPSCTPGGGDALKALLSDTVQLSSGVLAPAHPQIKSGTIKGLAVTGKRRWHDLPDIPTMAESGYKDFVFETYTALMAPAKTPPEVVARLEKDGARRARQIRT